MVSDLAIVVSVVAVIVVWVVVVVDVVVVVVVDVIAVVVVVGGDWLLSNTKATAQQ